MSFKPLRALVAPFALLLTMAAGAPAQTAQTAQTGVPNALQGFSQNRSQPVKIESASLEVRDKDKMATFSGDVHLRQGDTTLTCKSLVVYYDDHSGSLMKTAQPGPGGQQQIRRVEAKGGVTVCQKDQTATGNTGVFDLRANTVTLNGNVIVTQGANVLRGERLIVDLTTGVSRVEGGRVQGLFLPHSQNEGRPPGEAKEPPKPATRPPCG
jgi:lipopolysaccharide export system protein LptA